MNNDAAIKTLSVNELRAWIDRESDFVLLDVRRASAFSKNPRVISGAQRVLPESIADWSPSNTDAMPIVTYCVYGHEVSQGAAASLIAKGFNACYLVGGIEEWIAQGGKTVASII